MFIYEKTNPHYKEYLEKAYKYHGKAVELKDNIDWARTQLK